MSLKIDSTMKTLHRPRSIKSGC